MDTQAQSFAFEMEKSDKILKEHITKIDDLTAAIRYSETQLSDRNKTIEKLKAEMEREQLKLQSKISSKDSQLNQKEAEIAEIKKELQKIELEKEEEKDFTNQLMTLVQAKKAKKK